MDEKHVIPPKLISAVGAKIAPPTPSSSTPINTSLRAKELEEKKESKIASEFMKSMSTIDEIIMETTIHLPVIHVLAIDKQNTAEPTTENTTFAKSATETCYTSSSMRAKTLFEDDSGPNNLGHSHPTRFTLVEDDSGSKSLRHSHSTRSMLFNDQDSGAST